MGTALPPTQSHAPQPSKSLVDVGAFVCCGPERIESKTSRYLSKLAGHPNVSQSRQLGTIGAIKLAGEGGYFAGNKLDIPACTGEGVLLRPLGNVLYAMPPLSTTDDQLEKIYSDRGSAFTNGLDCKTNWSYQGSLPWR